MSKTSCATPRLSGGSSPRRVPRRRGAEIYSAASNAAFTIWTLSARFPLRVNLHDSRARSRRTGRRDGGLRPAEAKGHAGHDPDELVLPAGARPGIWPIGNGNRHTGVVDGRCSGTV